LTPLPAGLSLITIQQDMKSINMMLVPASDAEFKKCVEQIHDYAKAFGIKVGNLNAVVKFYRIALQDVPAVLLAKAVKDVITTKTYNTMPLPGQIREKIQDDLSAMKRHHSHLLSALKQAEKEAAKVLPASTETEEERQAKISLAMKSIRGQTGPLINIVKEAAK